jgi:hypothetical protein
MWRPTLASLPISSSLLLLLLLLRIEMVNLLYGLALAHADSLVLQEMRSHAEGLTFHLKHCVAED